MQSSSEFNSDFDTLVNPFQLRSSMYPSWDAFETDPSDAVDSPMICSASDDPVSDASVDEDVELE